MTEITEEMRNKLRAPLPQEAVSPHPTKSYLSSIKSIYVAERINDVFGIGSWTLKSEVIERLEKFVVVKAFLEIPSVEFYGEAYGGNDNADIGDAYKGATTDAFTKIAAQQLEIGIDVFKGLSPSTTAKKRPAPKATEKSIQEVKDTDPSKLKRDPDTIKTLSELYKACNKDFTAPDKEGKPQKMQPYQVIAELGFSSQNDISDTPADCYRKIATVRQ